MNTITLNLAPAGRVGLQSVLSLSITAALAAFTHAYEFGRPAIVIGAIGILLITALGVGYQHTGSKLLMGLYVLLNAWIILGFGVVGGFWNHAVKVVLCAAHGGVLPAPLEPWFISLQPGTVAYETAGILTFVAAVAAAVFGYRFVRMRRG